MQAVPVRSLLSYRANGYGPLNFSWPTNKPAHFCDDHDKVTRIAANQLADEYRLLRKKKCREDDVPQPTFRWGKASEARTRGDYLNKVREANDKGEDVTAPGVPESYGNPADLITDDCIQP